MQLKRSSVQTDIAFVQSDLECVQRGFAVVQIYRAPVQRKFVSVQSDLEAAQHGLLSVQDGFTAVYSDFVIVQSVLNARGWDLRCLVLDLRTGHWRRKSDEFYIEGKKLYLIVQRNLIGLLPQVILG